MGARLYIAVPCHNRKLIVERCLPTLYGSKSSADFMELYNDGSTEYAPEFLQPWADQINHTERNRGIEMQRKAHFTRFWNDFGTCSHLYLTDSDALHDPSWRSQALVLQSDTGGLPVCLYDTQAHASMKGNTLQDDITKNYIVRYYAPGISYLLTRAHVEKIMPWLPQIQHWDWDVPRILGHKMIVSRVSHVDHVGHGGLHHDTRQGYKGGDRATNPTPYLVAKRAEIVEELSGGD